MAKTLTILRAKVRTLLDEVTEADWKDTELDRDINLGYMKIYTAVVGVYEDYYSEKYTCDTVADQQEYDLPDDFYKIRRVQINYNTSDSNSVSSYAIPATMDEVMGDLNSTTLSPTVFRNPAYFIRGNKIGFIPVPDESGTDAITLWYIKTIDELSAVTDEIDIPFPDRYYNSIILEAAGNLLRKGQQEETVARQYLLEARESRDQMTTELEDRVADSGKVIVDVLGEDVDFSQPV